MRMRVLSTLVLLLAACGAGERDVDDVATDLEGTVTPATVDRVLRDVDLSRAALTIHVGSDAPERFGAEGQRALEEYLRDAAQDLSGAVIEITQRNVEDRPNGVSMTLTLRVRKGAEERFVPVVLDVVRAGRRWAVTRARVMR
ncbi:MAG: hypothetical protein R3A48_14975 [Polyangiales bacterium]